MVWVGASYRQNAGVVLLAGIKFAHRYAIGYAYDFPSSELKTGGSHEIHIGIHIGSRKRDSKGFIGQSKHDSDTVPEGVVSTPVEPVKTMVVTVPKPPVKKVSSTTPVVSKPEPIIPVKTTTPFVSKPKTIIPVKTTTPVVSKPETIIPIKTTTPVVITKPNPPKVIPQKEEKQSGNILDMEAGHYVVVGSFSSFDNAQKFNDALSNQGFLPDMGHMPVKNTYYVYLFKSQDISEATNEKKMLQRKPSFKNAWVLSIGASSPNITKGITKQKTESSTDTYSKNNLLSMDAGNYLVVESFKIFDEAQKYTDRLANMGFLLEIGFDAQTNLYHTFLFKSDNKEEVSQQKQKYSQNKYFKKLTILSVQ